MTLSMLYWFNNNWTALFVLLVFYYSYLLYKGNYMARKLYVYTIILTISFLTLPAFCISPKNPRNIRYLNPITIFFANVIGLKTYIEGAEKIPRDVSGVLVLNHQSELDIVAQINLSSTLDNVIIALKKEIMYFFPVGISMFLCSAIFIDRKNVSAAYKALDQAKQALMENPGRKLIIYPEGTRNREIMKTKQLLPFRKGAFRLAIAGQFPIYPVVISPSYFINEEKGYIKGGTTITQCLDPIETTGLTEFDVDAVMAKTRLIMQQTLDKMFKENKFMK